MRLIDADAITKEKLVEFVGNQNFISFDDLLWMISETPTVDAVPVVLCKDCKHSTLPSPYTLKYGKKGTLTCHNRCSPCNNRNVNENDFCSCGADM